MYSSYFNISAWLDGGMHKMLMNVVSDECVMKNISIYIGELLG